jgi:hypothetical protein
MRSVLRIFSPLALLLLLGADGCPLTVGDSSSPSGTSSSSSSLDVGGQNGATWQLTYETDVLITLRLSSGQAAAQKVPLGSGIATLLGSAISVSDLCFRTDMVCPQAVLPVQTGIQQPSTGGVLVGFNRRGPLAGVGDTGLTGSLSGQDLTVPLNVGQATQGMCAFASGSTVLASAYAANATRADTLQGRVIVVYSGLCATLAGAVVPADSLLELSVGFAGKRL